MEFALQRRELVVPTPSESTPDHIATSNSSASMIQTMTMQRTTLSSSSYLFTKAATAQPQRPNSAAVHPTTTNFMSIHSPDRSVILCRYPSKLCENHRSEKRGGGLHRFCAYHRERANINQRRVDHRRRLRKQGLPVPPIDRSAVHSAPTTPTSTDAKVKREAIEREAHDHDDELGLISLEGDLFDQIDAAQPLLPDLTEFDLQELMRLLEEDEDETTAMSAFSIKGEPQDPQDEQSHRPRW